MGYIIGMLEIAGLGYLCLWGSQKPGPSSWLNKFASKPNTESQATEYDSDD